MSSIEHLSYEGQSAKDRFAHEQYLADVARGKSALQLQAVAAQMTSTIRSAWAPSTFTGILTSFGHFDATVCNVSYHFQARGDKYGNIDAYTDAALRYIAANRGAAVKVAGGINRLPLGLFDNAGRIVSFFG